MVGDEALREAGLDEDLVPRCWPADRFIPGLPAAIPASEQDVTAYVVSPFFLPETVALSLHFPCEPADAAGEVRRRLVSPNLKQIDNIEAVVPQPSDDFASFLLFPAWTTFAGLSAVMLDLRLATPTGTGPAIGSFLTRPTTAAEIRREAGMYSMGSVRILVGTSMTPLLDHEQVFE